MQKHAYTGRARSGAPQPLAQVAHLAVLKRRPFMTVVFSAVSGAAIAMLPVCFWGDSETGEQCECVKRG